MPAVIGVRDIDILDAELHLTNHLHTEIGATVHTMSLDNCLLLPPPHEVRIDGRALRGEEYAAYEEAILNAALRLNPDFIRLSIEEMYVFDWEAFGTGHWASLQSAYSWLPGWLKTDDLPRWFGRDETKGPSLWASVEPPGLQVGGVLEGRAFDRWHREFLSRTIDLPVRPIAQCT